MQHAPGFLKLVNEAKKLIKEMTVAEARAHLSSRSNMVLLDVREDKEWLAGHAVEAVHLGKGVLERDLEARFPDPNTEILMYCGGGFRSALTCAVAQQMGYKNVYSLAGGYREMVAAEWPMIKGE